MFAEKKHSKDKKRTKDQSEALRRIEATMERQDFKYYIDNLKKINSADAVILVVDARNPFSCRYQPYEELLGKKLWFVINKIDLAPRESVIQWYKVFSTIGNSFAVKATDNIDPLIVFIKNQIESLNSFKIVITGLQNTGKRTIASHFRGLQKVSVEITKPWNWIRPSSDLVAINALELSSIWEKCIAHARDFISRCSIHSLMEVFGVTFYNEPDVVLKKFCVRKSDAAIEFFRQIQDGKYLFYTATPACQITKEEFEANTSEVQKQQFALSKTLDQHSEFFICLGSASQTTINEDLLPALHHLAAKNEEAARNHSPSNNSDD